MRYLVLLLAACSGTIGDPTGGPADPNGPGGPTEVPTACGSTDFVCGEPSLAGPDAPMRRLSRAQLTHTVRDLVDHLLGDGSDVFAEVQGALGALPVDQRVEEEGNQPGQLLFLRSDQSIGELSVRARYGLAESLAAALAVPARLEAMGFECLVDEESVNDAECVDRVVDEVGLLTHRRPLDDEERVFYRGVYGSDLASLERVERLLTVLFAQPHFLFHVEGTGELTAYEAASRLSYQFWDTMPDSALLAAAESGALLTGEGWQAEVERVLADPRAEQAMASFLEEWFRFDQLNLPSTGSSPDFAYVAEGLIIDEAFDAAVRDELVDLFVHVVRSGGSFEDYFLSTVTTTSNPSLAAIYGVEPSVDGEPVELPPERHSLLTRTGMLLGRSEVVIPPVDSVTHPILRGVFILRQITCQNLPPAPAGAMENLPPIDRSRQGAREATSILTGASRCASCHDGINAAGFALEAFDPIGQYRSEEALFDDEGAFTTMVPIDDEVVFPGQSAAVQGGVALSESLFCSEAVSACFARHYVRFSTGRHEDRDADGCLLAAIDEAIDEGEPLRDVLASLVLQPGYRVRGEVE
ncbi:MAG: DUF1592 domain-containing protein [Myxococcota bacterium]